MNQNKAEWFYRSLDYPERLRYYSEEYQPWLPQQYQWRMIFLLVDGKGKKRASKVCAVKLKNQNKHLREQLKKARSLKVVLSSN
jgi:hypothetical protein